VAAAALLIFVFTRAGRGLEKITPTDTKPQRGKNQKNSVPRVSRWFSLSLLEMMTKNSRIQAQSNLPGWKLMLQ
jgi:hypothetical protein